jgi:hypothetical protein
LALVVLNLQILLLELVQLRVINGGCLGGVMVSVLAIGPKVRRFRPSQVDGFFKGDKNPQHAFLQRGSKAVGPMTRFYGMLKNSTSMTEIFCRHTP